MSKITFGENRGLTAKVVKNHGGSGETMSTFTTNGDVEYKLLHFDIPQWIIQQFLLVSLSFSSLIIERNNTFVHMNVQINTDTSHIKCFWCRTLIHIITPDYMISLKIEYYIFSRKMRTWCGGAISARNSISFRIIRKMLDSKGDLVTDSAM